MVYIISPPITTLSVFHILEGANVWLWVIQYKVISFIGLKKCKTPHLQIMWCQVSLMQSGAWSDSTMAEHLIFLTLRMRDLSIKSNLFCSKSDGYAINKKIPYNVAKRNGWDPYCQSETWRKQEPFKKKRTSALIGLSRSFLLWGDRATHCPTVPPLVIVPCVKSDFTDL